MFIACNDIKKLVNSCDTVFWVYFFKRSTFVGSAWSFGFFIPAKTANDLWLQRIFYPRFCPISILQKEPLFPFLMLSAKQGTYWYHFITSLVWRGPWLGIEPGTCVIILFLSEWNCIVILYKAWSRTCIFIVFCCGSLYILSNIYRH